MNNERVTPKNAAKELQMDVITLRELMKREKLPIGYRENFWMLNWLDEYMTGHKGFICGGCFKNIFNKEKVKDLDIFFENESDFDDAVQYFDSQTPGYDGDDVRDAAARIVATNCV